MKNIYNIVTIVVHDVYFRKSVLKLLMRIINLEEKKTNYSDTKIKS
jgi:hypothetical protein